MIVCAATAGQPAGTRRTSGDEGMPLGAPGSTKGLQLVVDDVGVHAGVEVRLLLRNPDGNGWAAQELRR